MSKKNVQKENSIKRLLKDLKEWREDPIENIYAEPEEKNLFKWHVILNPKFGQYGGIKLHLLMIFKEDYPRVPPSVKVCSYLKHPNVFGEYICLDMLKEHESGIYRGWTSCYTVSSKK